MVRSTKLNNRLAAGPNSNPTWKAMLKRRRTEVLSFFSVERHTSVRKTMEIAFPRPETRREASKRSGELANR